MPNAINYQGRILIVDDNMQDADVLPNMLRSDGYEVLVANNGYRGLDLAREHQPELMLIDVTMPGIDGYTTCKRLKEDPLTSEVPVIFLTALGEAEDKRTGYEVGGLDYLTKPLQLDEVRMRIATHLTLHRMSDQITSLNQRLHRRLVMNTSRMITTQRSLKTDQDSLFLSSLTEQERQWFLAAAGSIVLADGIVESEEAELLESLLKSMEAHEETEMIADLLRKRQQAELPEIEVERSKAFELLLLLIRVAAVDGRIVDSELAYFTKAAQHLGFPESYVKELVAWAPRYLATELEKKRLRQLAELI
jgi:DNA-binding response OmpR family regulator